LSGPNSRTAAASGPLSRWRDRWRRHLLRRPYPQIRCSTLHHVENVTLQFLSLRQSVHVPESHAIELRECRRVGEDHGPVGVSSLRRHPHQRQADDHAHRPAWIPLRIRDTRDGRQRGSTCCQMQESATLNYHALLSVAGHTVNSSGCLPTPNEASPQTDESCTVHIADGAARSSTH
jgi:hypothetical protein